MSNATRWYTTREAVKAAVGTTGAKQDAGIDAAIEAASSEVEASMGGRRFIPYLATKTFPWPPYSGGHTYPNVLHLDDDLLSLSALTRDTDDAVVIAATDYFLEPNNSGPPYERIEIDLASSNYFGGVATPQRAIRATGIWGYCNDTKAAGALAGAIASAGATALDVTDASKIGVGDTLLIDSEQLFVSERSPLDTTADLNDTLAAESTDTLVTVTDGTKVKQGEVILVESEKMLVESVAGNNLIVERAFDGSVLAAHSGAGINIYAYRTLTVVRGVNGTTAATHLIAAAVAKYAPPGLIAELCIAEAISFGKQSASGWTGQSGGGEGSVSIRTSGVEDLRARAFRAFGKVVFA